MRIKIISFIKRQQEVLRILENEYLKRISRYLPCELIEIKRAPVLNEENRVKILRKEAEKLETHLKASAVLVVLDSGGREYNSRELADWLQHRIQEGDRELVFVMGGPLGLSDGLLKKARWKWSLSKLTFPHKLVRVNLLESLYRSLEIARGGSYHK